MPLNLEPVRTGLAMSWDSLDERERMMALYFVAWVALALFTAIGRYRRERLKRDILEELHAGQG